jgi:hypothetical protein
VKGVTVVTLNLRSHVTKVKRSLNKYATTNILSIAKGSIKQWRWVTLYLRKTSKKSQDIRHSNDGKLASNKYNPSSVPQG